MKANVGDNFQMAQPKIREEEAKTTYMGRRGE